jgi:hypothetical protein
MIALEVFTILDDDVAVLEVDVAAASAPLTLDVTVLVTVIVKTALFTPSMITVCFQDRKLYMSSSLNIAMKSLSRGQTAR